MRRRAILRLAALVVVTTALAGCGGLVEMVIGKDRLPPRELYRLAPSDTLVTRLVGAPARSGTTTAGNGDTLRPAVLTGTLAIARYTTPGLYGDRSIVFRIGDTQYGAYPNREWALPLSEMLGHLTARLAAGTSLVREAPVYDPPSRRAHAYLWRATVREFEEVNRDQTVLVAVRIEASLLRVADDSVMWSGQRAAERAVPQPTMPQIVGALSGLAAETIAAMLADAEASLSQANIPPVPVRPAALGGTRPTAARTARVAP